MLQFPLQVQFEHVQAEQFAHEIPSTILNEFKILA